MLSISLLLSALLFASPQAGPGPAATTRGVLILAHGGQPAWNERVNQLVKTVDQHLPADVAFGMAQRAALQGAVDRLVARGVKEIVAVPLFVSSHSSVITSAQYLLGQRADMPPEVKLFAKMSHAGHGARHQAPAASAGAAEPTAPVVSPVPITMTGALDRHPLVAEILATRARGLSRDPAREAVVLVAHGPVKDEENARWVADLESLAAGVRQAAPFASIVCLTVRDDAPPPVRDAATAELRAVVERELAHGRRVLIVPVLLSYGGIEAGIRKRLTGLDYTMAEQALMPDDRLVQWVVRMAEVKSDKDK